MEDWMNLPALCQHYLDKCAGAYYHVRDLLGRTPAVVWLDADSEHLYSDSEEGLSKLATVGYPCYLATGQLDPERSWLLIKSAAWSAASVFHPMAQIANLAPAPWNKPFGGPTPLAATLAGGALGAGLGYAGGTLAEHLLPERVLERGRLRKTLAMIGAMGGAVPGAYLGTVGMRNWEDPSSSSWNAWLRPNVLFGGEQATKAASLLLDEIVPSDVVDGQIKQAWDDVGAGGLFLPSIPVDAFNRTVLADPFASPGLQAATVGVMGSASAAKGTGWISPYDIARVGMGMGAGLAQAYLGGKVLGALAGLTTSAQQQLQQAGMFAGALKAVVPGLFGG